MANSTLRDKDLPGAGAGLSRTDAGVAPLSRHVFVIRLPLS